MNATELLVILSRHQGAAAGITAQALAAQCKVPERRVRQLVRGDWVDFLPAGQSRRERLTWINPSRTLFVFSNSAAACAISITPEALAVRLRNKTAGIVLPDRPMFERAIHGAIQSLDKRA